MVYPEVFVGRQKQIVRFQEHFAKQFKKSGGFSLNPFSKKKKEATPYAQVFLLYGEDGFGKTSLLQAYLQAAEEVAQTQKSKLKTIVINWELYYDRKSVLPNTRVKMMDAMVELFIEESLGIYEHFSYYYQTKQQIQLVENKVETLKKANKDWAINISETVDFSEMDLAPRGSKSSLAPLETSEITVAESKTQEITLAWLRKKDILTDGDLYLYEFAEKELAKSLVFCLQQVVKVQPVVLAIDNYEIINSKDLDIWLREVFLKLLYKDDFTGITTIICEKPNNTQEYRNSLPETLLHIQNLENLLFTHQNTQDLAIEIGVKLNESQIKALNEYTKGIPLVVKDSLYLLKNRIINLNDLMTNLTRYNKTPQMIIQGLVERFIKHSPKSDLQKIFHLAMLRSWNVGVLSILWKTNDDEQTWVKFRDLADTYSFIDQNYLGMHKKVRQVLRANLVSQSDMTKHSLMRDEIISYGKNMSIYYKNTINQIKKRVPSIETRYQDENYQMAILDYCNALLWSNHNKFFSYLSGLIVEMMQFSRDLARQLMFNIMEFKPALITPHKLISQIILEGVSRFKPLQFSNFKDKNSPEVMDLMRYLKKEKTLDDTQRTLIDFRMAESKCRNQKYEEAFNMFVKCQEALQGVHAFEDALEENFFNLGYFSDDSEFTAKAYQKTIEIRPGNYHSWNNLGNAYIDLQKYKESIYCYKQAIEINDKFEKAWYNLGATYVDMKQYEKAIPCYEKAIEVKPDFDSWYSLGLTYTDMKIYEKAIFCFEKAIEINPETELWYILGVTYSNLQKHEDAIPYYKKSLEINANNAMVWYNLGITYANLGRDRDALPCFEKAVALNPQFDLVWYNLGIIYVNLGEYEKAIPCFERVVKTKPGFDKALYNIARAYNFMKNRDKTIEYLRKFVALNGKWKRHAYKDRSFEWLWDDDDFLNLVG